MTVVVEFGRLGGGDQTRCAAGDPDSGIAALRGAGFEPTRAAQQPGYFVCRIDGKPADDPCQRASPEDAYWSYWHAEAGGSWTFSNAGAAERDPEPGEVEGWAFGAGDPPSTRPPAAPPRSEPTPAAPPPAAPAPAAPAPAAPAPAPAPQRTSTTTAAPAPPAPTSGAPTAAASPVAPAASAVAASPEPSASAAAPLAVGDPAVPEEGSPLVGVLLVVAVVSGLGAAAAVQAQRRR